MVVSDLFCSLAIGSKAEFTGHISLVVVWQTSCSIFKLYSLRIDRERISRDFPLFDVDILVANRRLACVYRPLLILPLFLLMLVLLLVLVLLPLGFIILTLSVAAIDIESVSE